MVFAAAVLYSTLHAVAHSDKPALWHQWSAFAGLTYAQQGWAALFQVVGLLGFSLVPCCSPFFILVPWGRGQPDFLFSWQSTGAHEHKPTLQAHIEAPFVSHLLICRWPKHVTWPRPKTGKHSSFQGRKDRAEYLLSSDPVQCKAATLL